MVCVLNSSGSTTQLLIVHCPTSQLKGVRVDKCDQCSEGGSLNMVVMLNLRWHSIAATRPSR